MNKLEKFVTKLNFKKVLKLYLIISVLLVALCLSAISYVARDKIHMSINFEKASEIFEKEGMSDRVKSQIDKLATDSKDIKNIIVVDKNKSIIFKANNNLIDNKTGLELTPYEFNPRYLKDNVNENVLYKIIKKDDIILSKDYIKNNMHEDLKIDDEESHYERDLANKDVYFLNYLVNKNTGTKMFVIRNISSVPYLENIMELTVFVLALIFVVYWIGLALWVFKDASKNQKNPSLWGIIVLLTNLVGLIIYEMYKQNNMICTKCGFMQNKKNIYCTKCGNRLNDLCNECGNIIHKGDQYCSKCGNKLS